MLKSRVGPAPQRQEGGYPKSPCPLLARREYIRHLFFGQETTFRDRPLLYYGAIAANRVRSKVVAADPPQTPPSERGGFRKPPFLRGVWGDPTTGKTHERSTGFDHTPSHPTYNYILYSPFLSFILSCCTSPLSILHFKSIHQSLKLYLAQHVIKISLSHIIS